MEKPLPLDLHTYPLRHLFNEKEKTNMRDNPCKDCDKRHATCHSTCQDYLTWKKEYDEFMRRARSRRDAWNER